MKTKSVLALGLADVETARRRVAHGLRLTPCTISPALLEIAGRNIWLKRDDLQRTGSFKERGARNALLAMSAAAHGVASSRPPPETMRSGSRTTARNSTCASP